MIADTLKGPGFCTHCFLVYQMQVLAQGTSSMQARPCVKRVYLSCAGVTHLCQAQQHMWLLRTRAFGGLCLWGILYAGRENTLYEHGVLKPGKDSSYQVTWSSEMFDQLRNVRRWIQFSLWYEDQKSNRLWLVTIQVSSLMHTRHRLWNWQLLQLHYTQVASFHYKDIGIQH